MPKSKSIAIDSIRDIMETLSEGADDGWVTIEFVEKTLLNYDPLPKKASEGVLVGWRDIGLYVGRSPNALAVLSSTKGLPIEPVYHGRSPTYTLADAEKLKQALAEIGRRGR